MALPLILGIGAAAAALGGIGTGIHGGVKLKKASDTIKMTKSRHEANLNEFETANISTSAVMDELGKEELEILKSFDAFIEIWGKIHSKPEFRSFNRGNVAITNYAPEELIQVSVGASVLLGGLGGAAVGTAGGFAAAGATTAAVMALGTASTGTAIASLSGVAATNATLAALGGGAIAAGGGGMALGTTILGASTLGVGLLIGGVIFSISGHAVSAKANKAYSQMEETENVINDLCTYLGDLEVLARRYLSSIKKVSGRYTLWFDELRNTIERKGKTDWNSFYESEKRNAENTALIVGLLYEMCKVKLVIISQEDDKNAINYEDAGNAMDKAVALDVMGNA